MQLLKKKRWIHGEKKTFGEQKPELPRQQQPEIKSNKFNPM